jgi:hypothetical protein
LTCPQRVKNHLQKWDGKSTGSHQDSQVAKLSTDIGDPAFFATLYRQTNLDEYMFVVNPVLKHPEVQ